jgi:septal ring factor EnvC (AmiA/AmiB activator)
MIACFFNAGNNRPSGTACRPLLTALAAVLMLGSGTATCLAQDNPEQALRELRKRIQTISQRFETTRRSRDESVEELRRLELAYASTTRALGALKQQTAVAKEKVAASTIYRRRLQDDAHEHRDSLAAVVRATYFPARQDRLRLLLTQNEPASVARVLCYASYINSARARRISAIKAKIVALQNAMRSESASLSRLEQLERDKAANLSTLAQQRRDRDELIASLTARLKTDGALLTRLKTDEQRLTALIKELEREMSSIAAIAPKAVPFANQRGKLAWPVPGKLVSRFGTTRDDGDLKWQGVLIASQYGTPVLAVARGRVAYADWLRGYGLMLIIDHGDGYMSLYGHNQSLLKEVGEWVDTNETIANVGKSGGQTRSALYFEIRRRGEPQNPRRWCQGKPKRKKASKTASAVSALRVEPLSSRS